MPTLDNIEKRAARLVRNFDYDRGTRYDLKMQFVDHISNLKSEYMENGFNENTAEMSAISNFGSSEEMHLKPNIYVNRILKNLMFILLILSIALIAVCFLNPVTNEGQSAKTIRSVGYMYSIKLIPFKTIGLMFTRNSPYLFWFLYILLFIPLGIFMPFGINTYFNTALIFKYYLLSAIIVQIIRMIFPVGLVNIDILILNLIGCLLGFVIYKYIVLRIAMKNNLIYQNEK